MLVHALPQFAPQPVPEPEPLPPGPPAGSPKPQPHCGLPRLPKLQWPNLCPQAARPAPSAPSSGKLHFETGRGRIEVAAAAPPLRKLQTAAAVVTARLHDTAEQIAHDLCALAAGKAPPH